MFNWGVAGDGYGGYHHNRSHNHRSGDGLAQQRGGKRKRTERLQELKLSDARDPAGGQAFQPVVIKVT